MEARNPLRSFSRRSLKAVIEGARARRCSLRWTRSRLFFGAGDRKSRRAHGRFPESALQLRPEFLIQLRQYFMLLVIDRRREYGVVGN